MVKATGARHGMSYVAESVYGTTPVSPPPEMLELPHTGTTLALQKGELVRQTSREDGQIADSVHGNHRVGGNIDFEWLYGGPDDFIAAALRGTWSVSPPQELKVGGVAPSFTIERRFADIGKYTRFMGCVVDTLAINVAQSADGLFVTGTLGILGRTMIPSDTSLGSPEEQGAATAFKTFAGTISEGGTPIAIVTALNLSISNGGALRPIVGSHLSAEPGRGRFDITGSLTAYFDNLAMLNKFVGETESSLEAVLQDAAGNSIGIELPRVKYNGGDFPRQGEGDIILTLPFRALRDDAEQTPIIITRTEGP